MGSPKEFRKMMANSAKRPLEEKIMNEFWKYMDGLRLENNQSVELSDAINAIFQIFNEAISKTDIEKMIKERLKTEKYIYRIIGDGTKSEDKTLRIVLQLNKAEEAQRKFQRENNEIANEIFNSFIKKAELYAEELSKKRIPVTEESLRQQFGESADEKNKTWIKLAIGHVLLEHQEQDR